MGKKTPVSTQILSGIRTSQLRVPLRISIAISPSCPLAVDGPLHPVLVTLARHRATEAKKKACQATLAYSDERERNWCGRDRGSLTVNLGACTTDWRGGANLITSQSSPDPVHPECPSGSGILTVTHFSDSICSPEMRTGSDSAILDGGASHSSGMSGTEEDWCVKASVQPSTCDHVEPNSDCANQLRWAMTEGVTNHPEWYPGLTASSHISSWQTYLANLVKCARGTPPPCYGAQEKCPAPCPTTATSTVKPSTTGY